MPKHSGMPQIPLEPLQLSAEPLRTWVNDGRGGRVRPVMCVAVGAHTGLCVGMDMATSREAAFDAAGRVLADALERARSAGAARAAGAPTPGRVHVQVRDPELATALRHRIELAEADFHVVDRLDAVDAMIRQMESDLFPSRTAPSPLSAPGASAERLAAFAEGCVAFHAAGPWKHLHDDDVIEVHEPGAPDGMRFASVLGAGGQTFGLGFYRDAKGYDRLANSADPQKALERTPRWSLMFHAPDEMPPEDADLWAEHGLRVTADDSIPVLLRYRGMSKVDRPDGPTLTFVEGLCRALAATTEPELDSGRWEKPVRTVDGDVTYRLSIPHLLQPPQRPINLRTGPGMLEQSMRRIGKMIEASGAGTPEQINAFLAANVTGRALPEDAAPGAATDPRERATDLCYEAQGQRSRRALQLLREALRLDPDCAEAYVMLAQRQSDPTEAEALYRRGVEAGRRSLGTQAFEDPGYPFWGAIESRPFMRALSGLAESLERQDRLEEAADVLRDALKLNPGDNQGLRYRYVPVLIALGRLGEAKAMVESPDYRDDVSALFEFAAALIAFKQGRRDEAEDLRDRAAARCPSAVPFILNPEVLPPGLPPWSPGAETEGLMIADLLSDVWLSDPSAARWLGEARIRRPKRAGSPKQAPKRSTNRGGKNKRTR